jgi:hypothetical protein
MERSVNCLRHEDTPNHSDSKRVLIESRRLTEGHFDCILVKFGEVPLLAYAGRVGSSGSERFGAGSGACRVLFLATPSICPTSPSTIQFGG